MAAAFLRRSHAAGFVLAVALAAGSAAAQPRFEWSYTLPFTGGNGLTHGDLVAHDGGVTALHSRPDLGALALHFERFAADGTQQVSREVGAADGIHYEPSACWDGARYVVVSSTYTRGQVQMLDAAGGTILAETPLPGIPFGWRAAAFRVRCTPFGYAVFGLLMEPTYPGSAYHYTYLHYWLLDGAGAAVTQRDLGIVVAPVTYPGFEGLEKEYYDVAWTGAGFLLAYAAECGSPATFRACYRVVDLAGDTVRPETPLTTVPTQGPHLAVRDGVVGAATLRQNPFPGGNHLFARFFEADGTPRGAEQRYDDPARAPLGYAPAMVATRTGFLAAYVQADPYTLSYDVMLAPFDAGGARIADATPVSDPGDVLFDSVNLGVDFQLAAYGPQLYGKGQAGVVTVAPIVFRIPEPCASALAIAALLALRSRRARHASGTL